MGALSKGTTFAAGDQVTPTKLNNLVDNATLNAAAADAQTLELSGTSLQIKDLGVATEKLALDAVTGAQLADNAVDSEHYVDGSIDNAHLSADCVTADEMDDTCISGHTELAAAPDNTDEVLLSDAGVLKRLSITNLLANIVKDPAIPQAYGKITHTGGTETLSAAYGCTMTGTNTIVLDNAMSDTNYVVTACPTGTGGTFTALAAIASATNFSFSSGTSANRAIFFAVFGTRA